MNIQTGYNETERKYNLTPLNDNTIVSITNPIIKEGIVTMTINLGIYGTIICTNNSNSNKEDQKNNDNREIIDGNWELKWNPSYIHTGAQLNNYIVNLPSEVSKAKYINIQRANSPITNASSPNNDTFSSTIHQYIWLGTIAMNFDQISSVNAIYGALIGTYAQDSNTWTWEYHPNLKSLVSLKSNITISELNGLPSTINTFKELNKYLNMPGLNENNILNSTEVTIYPVISGTTYTQIITIGRIIGLVGTYSLVSHSWFYTTNYYY